MREGGIKHSSIRHLLPGIKLHAYLVVFGTAALLTFVVVEVLGFGAEVATGLLVETAKRQ